MQPTGEPYSSTKLWKSDEQKDVNLLSILLMLLLKSE